jgi:hypothetical protein
VIETAHTFSFLFGLPRGKPGEEEIKADLVNLPYRRPLTRSISLAAGAWSAKSRLEAMVGVSQFPEIFLTG